MSHPLDDLAAYLDNPEKPQRTPVPRSYEIFMGLGVVKTVNSDGTVAITYNGGNGDGTTTGGGPGLPAGVLGNYVPQVGDTVLVYSLGTQNWVTRAGGALGWSTYTPIWTASTTNPTLGNGSLIGRYKRLTAKTCVVRIDLIVGSTTNMGAGQMTFTLPFAPLNDGTRQFLGGQIVCATTGYSIGDRLGGGNARTSPNWFGTGGTWQTLAAGNPGTWSSSAPDGISIQGIYETA